jgi:hypothetical protein
MRRPINSGYYVLAMICAVYRRSFCGPAEAVLRSGHNKIDALFTAERTRIIGDE